MAVSASAGTKVFTTTNNEGKVTFHVTTSATLPSASATPTSATVGTVQPTTPKKTMNVGQRGVPPPVPPNKPVIPPKKSSSTSSTSTGASASINSLPGQSNTSALPVVISCSNNPQVTTVDRGRPISLELLQPVPKAGQVGSQQGVKFGITITKDKIQISSNPPPSPSSSSSTTTTDESMVQVGAEDSLGRSYWWASPEPSEHAESPPIIADPTPYTPLSPLSLALSNFETMLNKELDDFQQLLDSMVSPSSPSPWLDSSSYSSSSPLASGSSESDKIEQCVTLFYTSSFFRSAFHPIHLARQCVFRYQHRLLLFLLSILASGLWSCARFFFFFFFF